MAAEDIEWMNPKIILEYVCASIKLIDDDPFPVIVNNDTVVRTLKKWRFVFYSFSRYKNSPATSLSVLPKQAAKNNSIDGDKLSPITVDACVVRNH